MGRRRRLHKNGKIVFRKEYERSLVYKKVRYAQTRTTATITAVYSCKIVGYGRGGMLCCLLCISMIHRREAAVHKRTRTPTLLLPHISVPGNTHEQTSTHRGKNADYLVASFGREAPIMHTRYHKRPGIWYSTNWKLFNCHNHRYSSTDMHDTKLYVRFRSISSDGTAAVDSVICIAHTAIVRNTVSQRRLPSRGTVVPGYLSS